MGHDYLLVKRVEAKPTSYMVRPARARGNGCLSLSEFDQIDMTYTEVIYFYRSTMKLGHGQADVAHTLRDSLSRVLVPFYPLAGRLRWMDHQDQEHKGRLELDCNDNGVEFIEMESNAELVDFGDFTPSPNYEKLLPDVDNIYNIPIHERPVCLVQLTKFKCGGISLGLAFSHVVVDGISAAHFVREWARLARGEPLGVAPFHDRNVLQTKEPPVGSPRSDDLSIKGFTNQPTRLIDLPSNADQEVQIKEMKTTLISLKLARNQVEKLKKQANEGQNCGSARAYSVYEAISAHFWRTACKARNNKAEQPTAFTVTIDSRSRLLPPLPVGYFGNAVYDAIATSFAGELVSKPLGYGASLIRAVIEKASNDNVLATIDFLKHQKDLTRFRSLYLSESPGVILSGSPNFELVSWLNIPCYGIDFGWGKEVHFGPANFHRDGESVLLRSSDGDGSLVLVLCLLVEHVHDFKKYFYQDIMTSFL